MMWCGAHRLVRQWGGSDKGLAATEFALIFPVLLILLLGVFDFGRAFVINQKAITASQIMADLVSRDVAVTQATLDNIVDAGFQALRPFNVETYGYDIISLSYVPGEEDDEYETVICWRQSDNLDEQDEPIENAEPLAIPGEGLVIVTVGYQYQPVFPGQLMKSIPIRERAFARGRRTPVVAFQIGAQIGCDDELI